MAPGVVEGAGTGAGVTSAGAAAGAAAGAGAGAATFSVVCAGVVAAVAASGGVTVPSFWCGRLSVLWLGLGGGWRGATATGASGTVSATIATVSSASPVLYVLHGEAQVACASRTIEHEL